MARIKAVLWRSNKAVEGEYPVYLRLEASNRRRYVSLGFRVRPNYWNPKRGEVRGSHDDADTLNRIIHQKRSEAWSAVHNLIADRKEVTPSAIKAAVHPASPESEDFIAYGNAYAEDLRRQGKIPTSRRYFSIFRKLGTYTGGQLPLSELTTAFLREYRVHLIEHYGNGPSTVASNFRALKAATNRAEKDGLIDPSDNPFRDFPVVEPRSAKRKLTLDEIDAIIALDLPAGSTRWHVRNAFLLSFYCAGIRFRDCCLLKVENVRGGRLEYEMRKTGTPKSIGLVPNARAIVDAYDVSTKPGQDRVFPFLQGYDLSTPEKLDRAVQSRNVIVNKALKQIAEKAGIDTNLSFHMSRHSFADLARREGWDVYRISKALGHKDLKTTEAYLRGFDRESIDAALSSLFE